MSNPNLVNFHWLSPLGISVVFFILHGALYLLIGIAWPFAADSAASREILIMSPRTDTTVFGDTPENVRRDNPQLIRFRRIAFNIMSGLMVTAGVMLISLAWFGLRQGHHWALGALTLASAVTLPYWWLVVRDYWQAGAPPTLGDLPPFMWIPAALLLPAVILGWIGLR